MLSLSPSEAREFHARVLQLNGGSWFGFEPYVETLYQSILRPGSVALDGGANIGLHALPMARAVSPIGQVIALEPVPELLAKLEARRQQLGIAAHLLRIIPFGLGAHESDADFYQVTEGPQHELSGLCNRHWLNGYKVKTIQVHLTTIDNVCVNLPRLDFLKLDIEGGEFAALCGGRKSVEKFRPVISFEQDQFSPQYFKYTWQELFDYFKSLKYVIYDLFGVHYTDASMFYPCAVWDFVAFPSESGAITKTLQGIRRSMLEAGVKF
jgi:FkbM family methyltransferase